MLEICVYVALLLLWVAPYDCDALAVLVEGGIRVPHSLTIVNSFQFLALLQTSGNIEFYLKELPCPNNFRNEQFSLFDGEYARVINNIKRWNGERVDVIYRIDFPLDLTSARLAASDGIPTILFYVATLSLFTHEEMLVDFIQTNETNHQLPINSGFLSSYLENLPENVYFVTPSPGSAHAMYRLMGKRQLARQHRIIPHGVDLSKFYANFDPPSRQNVRSRLGIGPEDIMLLHVSAMVLCKGLDSMILALYMSGLHSPYKLVLKGLDDMYFGHEALLDRLSTLVEYNISDRYLLSKMVKTKVIFVGNSLSFVELNDLYNAADGYLSPYVSEGFNLPVLEAISVGLPVFVSSNGSTAFFIDHILESVAGSSGRIFPIPATLYSFSSFSAHRSNARVLLECLEIHENELRRPLNKYYYHSLRYFLFEHYSWQAISLQLRSMLHGITLTA